jgi:hypothetical protein
VRLPSRPLIAAPHNRRRHIRFRKSIPGPSASFVTRAQSIGSMKSALLVGRTVRFGRMDFTLVAPPNEIDLIDSHSKKPRASGDRYFYRQIPPWRWDKRTR